MGASYAMDLVFSIWISAVFIISCLVGIARERRKQIMINILEECPDGTEVLKKT